VGKVARRICADDFTCRQEYIGRDACITLPCWLVEEGPYTTRQAAGVQQQGVKVSTVDFVKVGLLAHVCIDDTSVGTRHQPFIQTLQGQFA
jgi:hypothetical protein